jgi:hypothetical protein
MMASPIDPDGASLIDSNPPGTALSWTRDKSILPVSFEQDAQQRLVYLPDQTSALLPSGRQAVWVGVE